ncbi:MAG: NERD domain-containing protein [Ideonella sp.]|nr:NERD domain-containing protein [Ideonella sp.]
MTAETLLAVLGLLLAMAAGPAVALIFMLKRKRSARAARRSPLTENLLRLPGETLREQIDRVNEQADAWLATLIFFPMLIVCLHLGQSYVFGRGQTWPRVSVAALLAIGVAVVASRKLLVLSAQLDRLRLGLDGEVAIGQELGKVTRRGAAVFHDVPAEGFNIDHVVVATQGVFAVETKGFSKPQPQRRHP